MSTELNTDIERNIGVQFCGHLETRRTLESLSTAHIVLLLLLCTLKCFYTNVPDRVNNSERSYLPAASHKIYWHSRNVALSFDMTRNKMYKDLYIY